MRLLLLLIFFILLGQLLQAQVTVGGNTVGPAKMFIGDFHSFDLTDKDMFGFERYGFGRGQMELTDRLSVFADSRGGLFLGKGNGIKAGLELGSGSVGYYDRPEYQYEPGVSSGLRETIGKLGFYLAPRMGLSYSNHVNDYFTGVVAQVQVFGVRLGYWQNDYNMGGRLKIYDLDINDKVNIQQKIQTSDTTTSISMRFSL
jgi:hypothetical protein